MLSAVRNAIKSPAFVVVTVLMIASFALWGVNDVFQAQGDAVTVVGGERVTVYELGRDFDRAIQNERQENPGYTQEQARADGTGDQVLNQLVLNAMLRAQARALGIAASDEAVRQEIRDFEVFTNPVTGGFDRDSYTRFLIQSRQRETQFETEIRNDLVLRQLTSGLFDGIAQPDVYRSILTRYLGEIRDLEAIVISPAAAGDIEDPTDEQLQATIDNNPQYFTTPERRAFTLMRLRTDDYLGNVTVDPTEVAAQYEYELETGAIGTPATRTYTQISFDNEAAARQAVERLANDEAPAAVASDLGGNPPSRQVERQSFQIPDENLRDALFEMAAGDSIAVETRFGTWFAIIVEAAQEEDIPTLETRSAEIRDLLAQAAAEDALYTDLGEYEEARGSGFSIEEAAVSAGLPYEQYQLIDNQGRDDDGRFAFGFFSEQEILVDVFARVPLIDGELTEYGDGNFYAVRVDEVEDARIRTLEEAREDAETVWRLQEIDSRLEDLAAEAAALVEAGQTFETIAAANPNFRIEQASLRRDETADPFGRQVVNLAFSLDIGDVEATRADSGRLHLVLRVNDARDGEIPAPEVLAQVDDFLSQGYRSDIDSSLVSALYRQFDFGPDDIDYQLRDQALGVVDPNAVQ
jgi:peptidyl-prolyl cis-trans isomerase D